MDFTKLPGRGRAVLAAHPIAAGELLLCERPIASMQLPDNAQTVKACAHCLRACGTISGQLAHAAQLSKAPTLPFADDADDLICEERRCGGGCGAVFCSAACETEARGGWHAYICADNAPKRKAVAAFENHAREEGENFLFGGRLVADVMARADALLAAPRNKKGGKGGKGGDYDACVIQAREVLAPFCRGAWWAIEEPPQGATAAEMQRHRRELRESARESLHSIMLQVPPLLAASRRANRGMRSRLN